MTEKSNMPELTEFFSGISKRIQSMTKKLTKNKTVTMKSKNRNHFDAPGHDFRCAVSKGILLIGQMMKLNKFIQLISSGVALVFICFEVLILGFSYSPFQTYSLNILAVSY